MPAPGEIYFGASEESSVGIDTRGAWMTGLSRDISDSAQDGSSFHQSIFDCLSSSTEAITQALLSTIA
jgi:hypothetical protein